MKTLIAYSTKYGTTKMCVDYLKKHLNGDVTDIFIDKSKNINLDEYDTIIVGGSVYMGNIRGAVKKFCEKYRDKLIQKKLGLFVCQMDSEQTKDELIEKQYEHDLIEHATGTATFGGATKISQMNGFHKFIFTKVAKTTEDEDKVNFDAIKEFAEVMSK